MDSPDPIAPSGGARTPPSNPAAGGRPWLGLVVLALLLVGVALVVRTSSLGAWLTRDGIRSAVEAVRGDSLAPVAYVLIYAVATTLAIPGSLLTLAGGALFGALRGALWVTLGANLGASGAFWLARILGRRGVKSLAAGLLGSAGTMARIDRATRDHGFLGLLTLRLIPVVPFNVLNLGAGLSALSWRTYAAATAIGILPGTLVYTWFADALLAGSLEASGRALTNLLISGALVLLLALLPRVVRAIRRRRGGPGLPLLALMALPATLPAQGGAIDLAPPRGHAELTRVLGSFVLEGGVDYAGLAADRAGLDRYLESLAAVDAEQLAGMDDATRIAFWVNAYNACMLRRVVDHYPIRPHPSLFGRIANSVAGRPSNSVWQIDDVFGGRHCTVAGRARSQDEIEHELLRPLGDPRIHFVVNCASASCPPLLPEALEPGTLDEQLERATRAFVNDPAQLRITESEGEATVYLNSILDWYGEDFEEAGGIISFLSRYLEETRAQRLLAPETRVRFLDYDWTLNDLGGTPARK